MNTYRAIVYNVVDGDTIDVMIDLGFKLYTKQRIRLARIDTPERGQPGFHEATNRMKNLLLDQNITLVTTKVSKWGYYVGDIYLNTIDINQLMLSEGLAKPYLGEVKSS